MRNELKYLICFVLCLWSADDISNRSLHILTLGIGSVGIIGAAYLGGLTLSMAGALPGLALLLMSLTGAGIGIADGVIIAILGCVYGTGTAAVIAGMSLGLGAMAGLLKKSRDMAFIPFITVGYVIWAWVIN